MRHSTRAHALRAAVAALAAAVFALPHAGFAEGSKDAPLAGVVRAAERPLGGIELLVHGISAPIASFSRVVRTAADGTWVVPSAPAGLYAISSLATGFRPAVARLWHRADGKEISFVTLNLERGGGVLPQSPLGASDPWIARAVTTGDVLREEDSAAVAASTPAPAPFGAPSVVSADLRLPLKASVSSMTGFGAAGGATISGTSVDVAGSLGPSLRWGLEGQYRRLGGEEGPLGNASRLSLDVAPGEQSIHVTARRQSVTDGGDDPARFAAQGIDWSAATGDRSHASVSAHLTSESNLLQHGPAADLFGRASNAFEVEARYRTESEGGSFVRFAVGYRSLSVDGPTAALVPFDRETHVGGVAGIQVTRGLSFEAGATGDVSNLVRGVMPELTIAIKTPDGLRIYGFVSRRFERRMENELPLARAGTDDAGLTRLSRALYRAGVRWDDASGGGIAFEASQRELSGTYRLLLDPEFLDNLDSLYFLEGDVARELSGSGTFRISDGLQGRLSARAGNLAGERIATITRDHARFTVAQAAVRVGVTGSSFGVGYRIVAQELEFLSEVRRNEVEALDFTLAQTLPFEFLRTLGSEWRALFSLEVGKRQEGEAEARANHRLAGGLSFAF